MEVLAPNEGISVEESKEDKKGEERECEFVRRMIERAYADKRFEDPHVITDLAAGKRSCNSHAATLVLRLVANQITRILQVVAPEEEAVTKVTVKRIYT